MLLMPNRRKVATLIVSSGGKEYTEKTGISKTGEYSEGEGDEIYEGKESCMDKFLIASERKDPPAMVRALERFIEMSRESGGE